MPIRFKCPHCKKPLAVKEHLAGKRGACPACKKPIVIPAPVATPADLEEFAAAALKDEPAVEERPLEQIDMECPMCGDAIKMPADLAGKQGQCPACRNIIKVPLPKSDKPKDWRDMGKKGPAAALINLPEQLDDAWGTELKGRVSRESLEDAGAIVIEVEPVGVGGWIKRVAIAAAVVLFVGLVVVGARNSRKVNVARSAFDEAHAEIKKLSDEKDPKKKPHPVLLAAIEWAEGQWHLQQNKVDKAREKFIAARALCGADAGSEVPVDAELFLLELARTQLELGGNEDQIRAKGRIDWADDGKSRLNVQREITQTVNRIKSPEAKVIAVRELASELIARKKVEMAIGLASGQSNEGLKGAMSPVLPQLTALVHAHDDIKRFTNLIKPPDPKKSLEQQLPNRLAYAEAYALKRELDEAKKLIDPNPASHRRWAIIGVVDVLMCDKSNSEAAVQAAPFVDQAVKEYTEKGLNLNPWHALQVCRAAYRYTNHADKAKELANRLPKEFKRRAQLEWILAQLEKGDAKADDLIKEMPDPEGPTRGLAWIALGRHFGDALKLPEGGEDGRYRVFALIGQTLGKDSTKVAAK